MDGEYCHTNNGNGIRRTTMRTVLQICFTVEEAKALEQCAVAEGKKLSQYAKELILKHLNLKPERTRAK
jgi:hypothetical protein